MTIHAYLMEKFPIRRSSEEKERFRAWAVGFAKTAGWDARTETTSRGNHQNIVIGDPEHAGVVFTAHYDTPAASIFPNLLMPRNPVLYFAYQFAIIALLIACSIGAAFLAQLLLGPSGVILTFLGVYFALLCLMRFGPSNKHNANDNTSGVAAVLETMRRMPEEARSRCAFILFDDEEKGCLGSKRYVKDHLQQQFMRLTVNLDCVGDGQDMLVISRDMARKCTGYHLLEKQLAETPGCTARFYDHKGGWLSSDHKHFKCGVAVCACRRVPVVGWLTGRIHTGRDTVCDAANLEYLASAFTAYVSQLQSADEM